MAIATGQQIAIMLGITGSWKPDWEELLVDLLCTWCVWSQKVINYSISHYQEVESPSH